MPARLSVALPPDLTGRQLASLAVLADQLGQGRWGYLSRSFDKLDQNVVHVPGPMAELLLDLAAGLRRAADDRERAAT